jgi:hypothetical protein
MDVVSGIPIAALQRRHTAIVALDPKVYFKTMYIQRQQAVRWDADQGRAVLNG